MLSAGRYTIVDLDLLAMVATPASQSDSQSVCLSWGPMAVHSPLATGTPLSVGKPVPVLMLERWYFRFSLRTRLCSTRLMRLEDRQHS